MQEEEKEFNSPQFVYHRCPANMQGSTLFPMNALPADLASVKSSAEKKYSWRSEVMDGVVPGIDCLWNDAIHCSPYHPRELYQAQEQAGIKPAKDDLFFEIPVQLVLAHPTVIYMYEHVANEVPIGMHIKGSSRGVIFLNDETHTHHDFASFNMPEGANDYFKDPSQFISFTSPLLRDITTRGVPAATLSYYKRCAELNCLPLTFFHVPHVLVKGTLSVADCRIVRWCDPES